MKKPLMLLLISLVGVLAISLGAFAQEYTINGSNYTIATRGTFIESNNIQDITAEGGNYSEINIFQSGPSDNWHVFYGNVEKNITLMASSGVTVYDFGSMTITGGYVAFSEVNTVDWSSVAACTAACAISEDTDLSLTNVDNISSTFAINADLDINLTGNSFSNSLAINTSGTGGAVWWESLIRTGLAEHIYLGHISLSQNNFLGGASDFQVMVPTSDAGTRTYYVYAGLQ